MNKRKVDELIPQAVVALEKVGIAKNGHISKAFRGQISTFGASVLNGSLLAAVAFFSERGGATVDRTQLMKAIHSLLTGNDERKDNSLYEYVVKQLREDKETECKEAIINASIALKIAMNVYILD